MVKYHYILLEGLTKNMTILSAVEDEEQVELVYTAGWNVKIVQLL